MRVLHLIPHLANGGTERQLNYLCEELVSMGHEVHVGYLYGEQEFETGAFLHKLKAKSNNDPRLLLQIVKLIKGIKPDVVNTWILQMDILGGFAAFYTRTPLVIREPSSSKSYRQSVKNRLRVEVGKRASGIIANSKGGVEYWKAKATKPEIVKIPNAVPVEEIRKVVPCALPKNVSGPILLYVGRLVADKSGNKNLDNLLIAVSKVIIHKPVTLVLCGSGPEEYNLKVLARSLGIESNIHFCGQLNRDAVWAWMKACSIFISLSEYEGSPNASLEAIACECTMILSDIPSHRELVSYGRIKLVQQHDIGGIAQQMLAVLSGNEIYDNPSRQKVGCSKNDVAKQYEGFYNKLII